MPLNDYTATVIGMVRDDVPFNTVLSADMLYIGNAAGCRRPRSANNNHYQYAETQRRRSEGDAGRDHAIGVYGCRPRRPRAS